MAGATTGTAVERYFFTPLYSPRTNWAVVKWWEGRRLFYNVSVGSAGLLTLATNFLFWGLSGHPGPPLGLVFVYALAANIFFSLGAPLDLLFRRWLGPHAPAVSQALFRYGYAFAVGLTLLPIPMLVFGRVMRAIFG